MISEQFIFLSCLSIKLCELGVGFAFNKTFAVTHNKVNLLKFPLWSSCSESTDDAFVLFILPLLLSRLATPRDCRLTV